MASLNEIRFKFLNYFEALDHQVVDSSPLVPRNDPTLMFTNSGMVQFKNLFTGVESRGYKRAVTSQKCVRAGGKHNDLDNVGYTARHLTFFEMLGNFSFGDYFKSDAIPYAWTLLTRDFGIDKEKLWVTVYHTDDEAAAIWEKIGVPDQRIIRIATDDNFWRMGPTGPCGPSTEIFYDFGDKIWGGPPGSADEDGDRFIEIWNLVFTQNEAFEDGSMRALDMKSIDTGMGLERFAALTQGTNNLFETDLMRALVDASADVTNTSTDDAHLTHHRVIADHLRSTSFLIAEGVLPSNEGRGYVLRRIMRRAMRHAHLLGTKDPLMHKLVPALVAQMGQAYPELGQGQAVIAQTLELEELRFKATLERGLRLLDEELGGLPDGADLPGATAFKLYDTFGFPLDLTQDALREMGRSVDADGFDKAMADQKAKARAAWVGSGDTADATVWFDLAQLHGATEFLGYETETSEGQILALVQDGQLVDTARAGEKVQIVMNQTPFYAESGGQVGDTGMLSTDGAAVTVTDTRKSANLFIHHAEVADGELKRGDFARLDVDPTRRSAIQSNHSATHLLHQALRDILGEHVAQRGSLNAADRLRFDYSHTKALTGTELDQISDVVNAYIRQNSPVETRIMTPQAARAIGAQALFGEKYGDEVRVVTMGKADTGNGLDGQTWSIELCGGTHVARTGDIGLCVVLGDSASSAGVRRIEALTGQAAISHQQGVANYVSDLSTSLKTHPRDLLDRVATLGRERKALQNEVEQLRRQLAMSGSGDQDSEVKDINGIAFTAKVLSGVSGRDLPSLIDDHKAKLKSGAVLLIADTGGKAAVAAGVTGDLTSRVSAVDILRAAVAELGGKGGGGRADMAQGGGVDITNASAAIAAAENIIRG